MSSNGNGNGSARDEYLSVLTQRQELELSRRRGELIDADIVDGQAADVAAVVKARMRAIPAAVCELVAAETRPAAVHALLLTRIDEALRELAALQFADTGGET